MRNWIPEEMTMMKVPFFELQRQYALLKTEIDQAIQSVLEAGCYVGGEVVKQFETDFAAYIDVPHCVGVGNATDALEIILRALDIGPGDEVLLPAFTWISAAEVVSMVGAKPVFVDVQQDTYTIDPARVIEKISPQTKAIIVVHLYGQVAAMEALMEVAQEYNIKLVEDCAQAHGAVFNDRKAGSIGHAAAFSFYPTKNLGALGDGGAIVTPSEDLALRCRLLANHGQPKRDVHQVIGRNSRLDVLQAAILKVKLGYLDEWNRKRRENAQYYTQALSGLDIQLPIIDLKPNSMPACHIYPILSSERDSLKQVLQAKGIATAIHYPHAIPFTPAYAHFKHRFEDFPVAYRLSQEQLSLPVFPELRKEEITFVVEEILDFDPKPSISLG